ncbi:MAG: hypothetical protein KBA26_10710 [Candidatus Delongbacteria bacterium]|nr:hypothetical protein [Candidatus Delongbacteria bacterium]
MIRFLQFVSSPTIGFIEWVVNPPKNDLRGVPVLVIILSTSDRLNRSIESDLSLIGRLENEPV